jgi:uncharacterized GH25 family protein
MAKRLLVGVAVVLLAGRASGHDYWLQPDAFILPVGKKVDVHLHVGDGFRSEEERPFQKGPTVRFQLLSGKDARDLTAGARDGAKPVARLTLAKPGNHLFVLERRPQKIKLEAKKFNEYLAEEGLDAVLAQRKRSGQDGREGRERYSRYVKALLQVGDARDDSYRREVGHRLEILPQANPYSLKAGDRLTVKVLFEKKPLAGARLFAHHRAGGKVTTRTATTSRDGAAVVRLHAAGPWLIRLVHMRACSDDPEVDWESFWGAYTFALR